MTTALVFLGIAFIILTLHSAAIGKDVEQLNRISLSLALEIVSLKNKVKDLEGKDNE